MVETMKNTLKYIALTLTAAIVVSSCAKENAEEARNDIKLVPIQFSASFQNNSVKSTIDSDRKVQWENGDKISILDPTSNTAVEKAFAIDPETNTVNAEIPEGANAFYGLYPYDAEAGIAGNKITTCIKSHQTVVVNNLPKEANLAIGYTKVEDKNMLFKNVGSLLSFSLDYDDIVSVTLSGNNGEKVSGKIEISYPEGGEPAVSFTKDASSSISLKTEDGKSFQKDSKYYMIVAPQTFTKGISLTLINNKGKAAVKSSTKELVLSRNGNLNLGKIDKLTFDAGLFTAYQNGATVKIAGQEYSKALNGEAILLDSDADEDLYKSISGKKGVFFLKGSKYFTNSKTLILGKELVLIADDPEAGAKYKPNQWSIRKGSIALSYIGLDMSDFNASYLINNHKNTAEDFEAIVFDNCKIDGLKKPLLYAGNNTSAGVSKISVTNSLIRFSGDVQLFNAANCSDMYKYKEIVFENNVFYAETKQNIQLFNYNHNIAQNGTTWEVKISLKNNIFYNLSSKNGLIKQFQVAGLRIGGNIYELIDAGTETSKSHYIFSEKQDKTLINNTGDKRYLKDPSSKWLYSGNANAYAAGVANELANEAADMFQSFDTKTGAYTLKNDYSAFGPQKAND